MIKTIKINEVQLIEREITLDFFLENHARFSLFDPIHEQWAKIYQLPPGKRIIYIYYDYCDSYGNSNDSDIGFLILEDDEVVEDRHFAMKEFCTINSTRIIHAEPTDR